MWGANRENYEIRIFSRSLVVIRLIMISCEPSCSLMVLCILAWWERVDMWSEFISSLCIWFPLQMATASCKLAPYSFFLIDSKWKWEDFPHMSRRGSQVHSVKLFLLSPSDKQYGPVGFPKVDVLVVFSQRDVYYCRHRNPTPPPSPSNRKCFDSFRRWSLVSWMVKRKSSSSALWRSLRSTEIGTSKWDPLA